VIEIRGLTMAYNGDPVLRGVDLDVGRGEWVGLIGPNGAGKSSLLRAVSGAVEHTGVVSVGGQDTATVSRRHVARTFAVVPQTPVTPDSMTVLDYVLLGRTPHLGYLAAESQEDVAICEAALWDLNIIHLAERPLGSLSGGERQRAVLARALAQQAPVLLLDEPTSALDIGHRQQVLDHVATLRRTRGIAVLAAMHDLTLAGMYADRLAFMRDGVISTVGTPEQVLTEEVIRGFDGARVHVMRGPGGEIVVVPRSQQPPA
jgi:iron complex transport system ATP-binding protein